MKRKDSRISKRSNKWHARSMKHWIRDKRKQNKLHENRNTSNLEQDVITDGQLFEGFQKYLGIFKKCNK
jgi:hypothetical protein